MMELLEYRDVDIAQRMRLWEEWWSGRLGRPLFHGVAGGWTGEPGYGTPFIPILMKRFSESELADYFLRSFAGRRYFGDGYPVLWMNYGPGVLAAMVGGTGYASDDTVWFGPGRFAGKSLREFSLKFDPQSEWCVSMCRHYRIFGELFGGKVKLGMSDLGGVLDVLASLRGAENLLLDLYDDPDTVRRLLNEEREAFQAAFVHLERQFSGVSPGSTSWAEQLSRGRGYMTQSDFSYMISPDMFLEFVVPQLTRLGGFLEYPFYHLDGIGEIPHLEHLLKIPTLRGIQWVPGSGQPEQSEWPEVIGRIDDAGLKLQLLGSLQSSRKVLSMLKHPENAQVTLSIRRGEEAQAEALLAEYGAL